MILGAIFLCLQAVQIDGDTIKCADQARVRIWGIQAPERADPGGPASTRAMANLVAGKDLRCEVKGPPSFNRIVALCRIPDGRDVAGEMIKQGRAREWISFSKGYYSGVGR